MQGSTFLCTRIRSFSTRSAVFRIDYFVDCFLVPRTSGVQLSCISISTLKTEQKGSFSLLMHISLYPVFLQVVAPRGLLPLVIFGFYTVVGSDRIGDRSWKLAYLEPYRDLAEHKH